MQDRFELAAASFNLELLGPFCRNVRFEPGDILRRKGQHYRDMYLITDGRIEVELDTAAVPVTCGAGWPIGEIAFLRGCPATATATARTAAGALIIDDPTLARLENEQPILIAQLLRSVADLAEERTFNLTFDSPSAIYAKDDAIDVLLCRNQEMLESAQRLRYEVYCEELGRSSPYADHDKKIITDDLDAFGHSFLAIEAGESIGTLRVTFCFEGSVGILEEVYGMRTSAHHPAATSICTKFIVRKSKRGGPAAMKLVSAAVRFGVRHGMKECYIDCIPTLLPYYKALGFTITAEKFFHRENGPSHPMRLDLAKHGGRLSSEFTARDYLGIDLKARAIKWLDRLFAS